MPVHIKLRKFCMSHSKCICTVFDIPPKLSYYNGTSSVSCKDRITGQVVKCLINITTKKSQWIVILTKNTICMIRHIGDIANPYIAVSLLVKMLASSRSLVMPPPAPCRWQWVTAMMSHLSFHSQCLVFIMRNCCKPLSFPVFVAFASGTYCFSPSMCFLHSLHHAHRCRYL